MYYEMASESISVHGRNSTGAKTEVVAFFLKEGATNCTFIRMFFYIFLFFTHLYRKYVSLYRTFRLSADSTRPKLRVAFDILCVIRGDQQNYILGKVKAPLLSEAEAKGTPPSSH